MPEERTGVQPGVSLVGLTEASDGRRREITTRLPSTIYLLNSALPCTSNLLVKFPRVRRFVVVLFSVWCACVCVCVRARVRVSSCISLSSIHSFKSTVCVHLNMPSSNRPARELCHLQTDQHWSCAIKQTSTGAVPSNRPALELCHQTDQHWSCAIKQTSTGAVLSNRPALELCHHQTDQHRNCFKSRATLEKFL